MTGPRLSEQLQLAFAPVDDRRASAADGDGAEPVVAEREPERPAVTDSLMEAVCERENLKKALRRVKTNKGSPGIDGMTVDQLPDYLRAHWPQHRDELYVGTYTPSPVKRVEIPKPHGGVRKLGIPTVLDRFIQQAVLQVLQPEFDPDLLHPQLRLPAGAVSASGGGGGASTSCERPSMGRRPRSGEILRSSQPRSLDGAASPARAGYPRAQAGPGVPERRGLGGGPRQCHGGRHPARGAAVTPAVEHCAPRLGLRAGTPRSPFRALCGRL